MVQNVVHGHVNRGVVAQNHHAQAIANQEDRYPSLVCQARRRIIIGCNHGYLFTVGLHLADVPDGHPSHGCYLRKVLDIVICALGDDLPHSPLLKGGSWTGWRAFV